MSISLIPEFSNFFAMGFVVITISAGVVAAAIRFSGLLKDVIQG